MEQLALAVATRRPERNTMYRRSMMLAAVAAPLLLAACGSSSSSGGGGTTTAPTGLGYSTNPAVYTVGTSVPQNRPSSTGGAVTSYTVTPALPAGLSLDSTTGVISGTPSTVDAAAVYTVTASNAAGSATVGLSIAVTAVTLPPSSLGYSANPAIYTVGTAITPNTPASTGGAVTSYSVAPTLPSGLTLDATTGVLSGTPTAAAGAAVYTVTATNSAGSTTVGLGITVNAATVLPAGLAYQVNPAVYTAGTSIAPNAPSSTGGAITSYSVSPALPAGLSINATTGVVSGTPSTATSAANYTVTGSNSAGSTTASLNITVNAATVPPTNSIVSGTVVKGPASGASVIAYAITNGTMAAQIGGGTTDAMGNFSFSIGTYSGPVMIQASGGTYADEATGTTMTMQSGDVMACAIPSVASGATTSGIQITPLTTMAHSMVHHMTGGLTAASMTSANANVGTYFSVSDILHAVPMNPMVTGSGTGATQDQKNYGMAVAAMSQYASAIGMPYSSGMVTAMANDASDGVMDGKMAGTPIAMGGGMMSGTMMQSTAGTSGLGSAMTSFVGSSMNKSGVTTTDMQALISKLMTTNGQMGTGGTSTPGMMNGTATKGAVGSATVTAYAIAGGAMGAQIGSGSTDAMGNFSVAIGTYSGPVMLQVNGGSFMDEATGSTMPMMTGDVLTVCLETVAAGATTSGIQVTPLTSMAQARAKTMSGGMTDANIGTANGAVGSYFSVSDILHVMPMDPTATGSGAAASQDQKNYGMSIAAMTEYAKSIGMTTSSSGIVTAMMNDASDGVMNGMMGSTAISMAGMGGMMGGMMQATAGTSGLSTAMGTFIASAMNKSGVTASQMQALMNQIAGSSGQLPGAGGSTSPQGSMAGTAYLGAMSSGTVTAYAVNAGTMGAAIGSSPVDASGNFNIPMGSYAGTVMLQMTAGSFMDEATGTTMSMQSGDVMTSCVPSVAAGAATTGVQVTPLTSMAQSRAQYMVGGMTAANVAAANAAVGSYFMVADIVMTHPMDPAVAGSGSSATQDQKNYGMSIAAMSQYAKTTGMTVSSSGMVTAMMQDATDGTMNGKMGSTSISMSGMGGGMGGMGGTMMQSNAGTAGMASAMSTFVGSAMNHSGVIASDVQALMNKLASSSGTIQ